MDYAIERVELYYYRLPLLKPLRLSAALLTERESLLLKWTLNGRCYWTEIAPLPGYSRESLAEADQQVRAFFKADLNWTSNTLSRRLATFTGALSPSVEMGLAALFLELENNYFGIPKLCGLLTESDLSEGVFKFPTYSAVTKVKVGLHPIEEDIERIRRICSQNNFRGKLRLDANQQWTPDFIDKLCANIDITRVQWIEDPLRQADDYERWEQFSKIPFAYDETLFQSDRAVRKVAGLVALILKPSLLGMARTLALLEWAQQQQINRVISSGFETPIGLRALYALANKTARTEYHGLDTLKYFINHQSEHPIEEYLHFEQQLL